MIHVYQCFQAVGHGTFFTGIITEEPEKPIFSWVYDCGSKRTTRLEAEISEIEPWKYWPDEIDLFVLSHFDDDHVNGVERFLRTKRVRNLALPYLDTAQRLAAAASTTGDACSASTALFQLDTIAWLKSRGLLDHVGSILLVRGGRRGPNDPPGDIEQNPLPLTPNENESRSTVSSSKDEDLQVDYLQGLELSTSGPKLLAWKHTIPTSASGAPIEFMFFNTEQNNLFRTNDSNVRVAKRSGASIATVQADISTVMHRYRLMDLSKPPRRRWREELRKVYDRHFGHSSQARNNISLCLLVRPRATDIGVCTIFNKRNFVSPVRNKLGTMSRGGLLLLGDLRVDSAVINEMKNHFGLVRWDSISGVQIPHHGSQHSWQPGNAAAFAPEWFVHCVPDSSTHHPHKFVENDLKGFNVLRADYQTRVAFNYHLAL